MLPQSMFRHGRGILVRAGLCSLFCLSSLAPAHAATRDIAFGSYHAVALRDDGRVLTWGLNSNGQLGRGETWDYSDAQPRAIEGPVDVVQVAAASAHSMALTGSGAVWTWGWLSNVQAEDPYRAVQVQGLPPIQRFAAGGSFRLFLTSGGDLYCVGGFACGGSAAVASPVLMLRGVRNAAAGLFHAMALKQDGTLYVWGQNEYGQVGVGSNGRNNYVATPTQILSGVASIAAGVWSSYAMKTDGTVWAWGYNGQGRDPQTSSIGSLCTGDSVDRLVPAPVAALPNGAPIAAIAAGGYNLFLKDASGQLYACGDNRGGKLGLGLDRETLPFTATPLAVPGVALSGTQAMLRVGMNNVAVASDGCELALNGYNGFDLIDPQSTQDFFNAFSTGGTLPWSCAKRAAIAAADRTAFFLGSTKVWGVGSNTEGELGTGTSTPSPLQLPVSQVLELAAGHVHTLALRQDGTVWGWGDNQQGQLGFEPSLCSRRCPRAQMPGIDGVTQIVAGWDFSLMLKTDGTVWITGKLPPSGTSLHAPTPIAGIDGVTQIVAGGSAARFGGSSGDATIFMKTAAGWHGLGAGLLLGGTEASQPVLLPQLADMATIRVSATGVAHACAQKSDRSLWCWGRNTFGQLGNGTTASSTVPVAMSTPGGAAGPVIDYAVGIQNTAIVTADGRVWMTGDNNYAQMGNGTVDFYEHSIPQVVSYAGTANTSVHMEHNGVYAARAGCFPVQAWGSNENGNLGVGSYASYQLRPTAVVSSSGSGYLDLCQ
jgi:alpha-tubulin suppressor-like RCC1 family protein